MAKNVKINSVVYAEVPQVSIPLAEGQGTAVFYDTTGATAASGDILTGKAAFIGSGFVAGAMAVAVAITLFGTTSPAALATTVGVLTEVPVMLALVKVANNTKGWFKS